MRILNSANIVTAADLNRLTANEREWVYNGLDCAVTFELLGALERDLDQQSAAIYSRSLTMRSPILDMSMRGILVDERERSAVRFRLERKLAQLESMFNRLTSEGLGVAGKVNWSSPVQVKKLLYEVMGLPPVRGRNANGDWVPVADAEALEKLSIHFWAGPVVDLILSMRELGKKLSFLATGIDADGRMRATFNIAGTKTGRLASSASEFGTGTNQQNIDRALRTIFIPDPGKKFINIDLEQGDSRNLGALCWDVFYDKEGPDFAGSYLDACESADLHTTVCRMAWRDLRWPVDPNDIKGAREVAEQLFYRQDTYRQMAKKLGHGTNYVGTAQTMALHTKMPVGIISDFQLRYFGAFPCIPQFHKWVGEQLEEYSCLTTLHGRRRYFFGRADDKSTLREAVAYDGQSMTADAVNKGMIQLYSKYPEVELLCQVHDSLLLQLPAEMVDDYVPKILEATKAPLVLKGGREFVVPNEAKVGWNWGDAGKENEFGLAKWKGSDSRKFEKRPLTLIGR